MFTVKVVAEIQHFIEHLSYIFCTTDVFAITLDVLAGCVCVCMKDRGIKKQHGLKYTTIFSSSKKPRFFVILQLKQQLSYDTHKSMNRCKLNTRKKRKKNKWMERGGGGVDEYSLYMLIQRHLQIAKPMMHVFIFTWTAQTFVQKMTVYSIIRYLQNCRPFFDQN